MARAPIKARERIGAAFAALAFLALFGGLGALGLLGYGRRRRD